MSEMSISNEVCQQFLRRTPIKLRQFSRLLNDMQMQKIDPLRVKALLSQINKTREACVAQGYTTTANLLNQIFKQLSMGGDSLETQKPLLKRLSKKLQQHSEKFAFGAVPKKEHHPQVEAATAELPVEEPEKHEEAVEAALQDEAESADFDLQQLGIYLDRGTIIFVDPAQEKYIEMSKQLESVGVEAQQASSLEDARKLTQEIPGSLIVASLSFAEQNEMLEDQDIEISRQPLIYTAQEDTQHNRLLALRSGGTGYLVEPISLSGLLEFIERQYDIHADSPYRVLVMDDSRAQAKFYDKVLSKGHFSIRLVTAPSVFMEALRGFEPELVLMDMQMPGCSGVELTRLIRQMPRYAHLPIIFLSGEENERKQSQALLAGGTSFIVKPAKKEQLMFLANLYASRYREIDPQIGINPDTGLAYSAQFKQQLSLELSRFSRNDGHLAMAIMQLDEAESLISNANFALINNAIQQLALLLKKRLRKTDFVGHVETGQLAVILTTGQQQDWFAILDDIRQQFSRLCFQLDQQDKSLTISIGGSALCDEMNTQQWFERATGQLAMAVEQGGDQVQFPALVSE